jgi:predicted ATPase
LAHLNHLKKIASGGGGADKQHKRILSLLVESGEITLHEAHRAIEMQTELKLKGVNKPISEVLALAKEQHTIAMMIESGFFEAIDE